MTERQVVLDTETTGLEYKNGHKVIEIGCVELIDRRLTGRHYHQYIQPNRESDAGALEVHGITSEFLADKPVFESIAQEFVDFVKGAELIIHNAPFDIGFLDVELANVELEQGVIRMSDICTIEDTLVMAKHIHPGQRNNLDALCQRYMINNTHRTLHGALLDSEILAEVYLAMTGGQTDLLLVSDDKPSAQQGASQIVQSWQGKLKVQQASQSELEDHKDYLLKMQEKGDCLWGLDET